MKCDIQTRKVIVELEGELGTSYLTMDERGQVRNFPTAQAVVRWVKTRDRAAASKGTSRVTTIEWRGMPEGFTPPEAY